MKGTWIIVVYLHYVEGTVRNKFFFTDFVFMHSEEE